MVSIDKTRERGFEPGSRRASCEERLQELAGPEFERAGVEGRELTLDDAVKLALGEQ